MPTARSSAIPPRCPLPSGGLELFRVQVWLMAELTGVIKDAYVRDGLVEFDELILRRISTNITKRAAVVKQKSALKFMEVFKHQYMLTFDTTYFVPLKNKDFPILEKTVARLESEGATIEEYMEWLFDDFKASRKDTVAIGHHLACSDLVMQEFFTKNADLIRERRAQKRDREREYALLNEARALYRDTSDPAILDAMERRGAGKIDQEMFVTEMNLLKKKHVKKSAKV